jgi:hypothetical protein
MPSAIRSSLHRGLRFVGLGIAYAFSLATSSPAANAAAVDSPIQIIHCRHYPSRHGFQIVFRNHDQRTVDRVSFSVDNREGDHQLDARGVFSPGITIERFYLPLPSHRVFARAPKSCVVTAVHFSDGSTWNRGDPPIADSNARVNRPVSAGNNSVGSTARTSKTVSCPSAGRQYGGVNRSHIEVCRSPMPFQ